MPQPTTTIATPSRNPGAAPRLESRVVARAALTAHEAADMRALLEEHFAGVGPGHLRRGSGRKVPCRAARGRCRAPERLHHLPHRGDPGGRRADHGRLLGRHDRGARGLGLGRSSPRAWIRAVYDLRAGMPAGELYWLLLTSGFRTYRFLSVFWRRFYPRFDAPTPPRAKRLLDALSRERLGDRYDATAGLVRFERPQVLRAALLDVPDSRQLDPDVRFFLERNPGLRPRRRAGLVDVPRARQPDPGGTPDAETPGAMPSLTLRALHAAYRLSLGGARRRLERALRECEGTQRARLRAVIRANADTAYGRAPRLRRDRLGSRVAEPGPRRDVRRAGAVGPPRGRGRGRGADAGAGSRVRDDLGLHGGRQARPPSRERCSPSSARPPGPGSTTSTRAFPRSGVPRATGRSRRPRGARAGRPAVCRSALTRTQSTSGDWLARCSAGASPSRPGWRPRGISTPGRRRRCATSPRRRTWDWSRSGTPRSSPCCSTASRRTWTPSWPSCRPSALRWSWRRLDAGRTLGEALWPRLVLVSCWADAAASDSAASLRRRLPHARLQPKGLLATEGVVSLPLLAGAGSRCVAGRGGSLPGVPRPPEPSRPSPASPTSCRRADATRRSSRRGAACTATGWGTRSSARASRGGRRCCVSRAASTRSRTCVARSSASDGSRRRSRAPAERPPRRPCSRWWLPRTAPPPVIGSTPRGFLRPTSRGSPSDSSGRSPRATATPTRARWDSSRLSSPSPSSPAPRATSAPARRGGSGPGGRQAELSRHASGLGGGLRIVSARLLQQGPQSAPARRPMLETCGRLREAWYAVALSSELKWRPLGRVVFETHLVLWRSGDGSPVALEDRCAHRGAPLSEGVVVGGLLGCPYHGWTYDSCGRSAGVPSQGEGGAASRLRSAGLSRTRAPRPRVGLDGSGGARRRAFPDAPLGRAGLGDVLHGHAVRERGDAPRRELHGRAPHHVRPRRLVSQPRPPRGPGGGRADPVERGGRVRPLRRPDRVQRPDPQPEARAHDHTPTPSTCRTPTRVDYGFGSSRGFTITSTCTPRAPFDTLVYTLISYRLGWLNATAPLWLPWYTRRVIQQDVEIMRLQGDNLQRFAVPHFHSTAADLLHEHVEALRGHAESGAPGPAPGPRRDEVSFWI